MQSHDVSLWITPFEFNFNILFIIYYLLFIIYYYYYYYIFFSYL